MNSRKRAPRATCAAPWLQWGYSRYPGQTKKRALPHQEKTDLCADSKKLYDRQATGRIVSCRAGRPEAGGELKRSLQAFPSETVLSERIGRAGCLRGPAACRQSKAPLRIASLHFESRGLPAAASDQFEPPSGASNARHWQRCGGQRADPPARRRRSRLHEFSGIDLTAPAPYR